MFVFKCRRFPTEIILVCVRWYCKYGISHASGGGSANLTAGLQAGWPCCDRSGRHGNCRRLAVRPELATTRHPFRNSTRGFRDLDSDHRAARLHPVDLDHRAWRRRIAKLVTTPCRRGPT